MRKRKYTLHHEPELSKELMSESSLTKVWAICGMLFMASIGSPTSWVRAVKRVGWELHLQSLELRFQSRNRIQSHRVEIGFKAIQSKRGRVFGDICHVLVDGFFFVFGVGVLHLWNLLFYCEPHNICILHGPPSTLWIQCSEKEESFHLTHQFHI